jgi:adenylate kinase
VKLRGKKVINVNIILTGAPGSGKGSQAPFLEKLLKTPVVSTGNMLRAEVAAGTELGKAVEDVMKRGELVSDELIIQTLISRIRKPDCRNGFILDGVPRTVQQAMMIDELRLTIDAVIYIDVPDEVIKKRLMGRLVCQECGATFHIISNPPTDEGICDVCGKELIVRRDDTPEIIEDRLETYHSATEPILDFYVKKKTRVLKINGNTSIQETSKQIRKLVL